jgi:hypothetical protein
MKNAVFWDVAPYRSCVNRRFGGTYRLYLQGRRIVGCVVFYATRIVSKKYEINSSQNFLFMILVIVSYVNSRGVLFNRRNH